LNRILLYFLFAFSQLTLLAQNQVNTGYCTFYADKFQGRHTASGEHYDKNAYTAAHRTLPFNTILELTNLRNNKKVFVRINDRGPAGKKFFLDISKAAALTLDMVSYGVEKVAYRILDSLASAYILDTLRNARYEDKTPKPATKTTPKTIEKKPEKTTDKPLAKTITPTAELKPHEVYDENLLLCKLQGYGVQVGYYFNKNNCTAAIATYEKTYHTEGHFWVDKKEKGTFYHLILGNYKTREEAEKLRLLIIKTIPGCFVMTWSKI